MTFYRHTRELDFVQGDLEIEGVFQIRDQHAYLLNAQIGHRNCNRVLIASMIGEAALDSWEVAAFEAWEDAEVHGYWAGVDAALEAAE